MDERETALYPLARVVALIDRGDGVPSGECLRTANRDFGYGWADIKNAIRALKPEEFYKRLPANSFEDVVFDVYRHEIMIAPKTKMLAYIKFYISDDARVMVHVQSFKEK